MAPVAGALGVGAYAYYDTGRVAQTTIDCSSTKSRSNLRLIIARAKPADSPAAP